MRTGNVSSKTVPLCISNKQKNHASSGPKLGTVERVRTVSFIMLQENRKRKTRNLLTRIRDKRNRRFRGIYRRKSSQKE